MIRPVLEQVLDGTISFEVSPSQACDKDGMRANVAELVNHVRKVRAHRLWRGDLLVIVAELESHVCVLPTGDLGLDGVNYTILVRTRMHGNRIWYLQWPSGRCLCKYRSLHRCDLRSGSTYWVRGKTRH